jgi:DNA polymerase epsilon subunit 1
MDFYFIEEDGARFKASLPYQPYFLVLADRDKLEGVGTYLTKRFVGMIASVEKVVKEDLDLVWFYFLITEINNEDTK